MRDLARLADIIGNNLASAGYALETIGNLLGADGSQHHISEEDTNGLTHAVLALSAFIKAAGYDLCIAAEAKREGGAQ